MRGTSIVAVALAVVLMLALSLSSAPSKVHNAVFWRCDDGVIDVKYCDVLLPPLHFAFERSSFFRHLDIVEHLRSKSINISGKISYFFDSYSMPKTFPYSFIVAGHAFGDHYSNHSGLYPKFYDFLSNNYLRSQSTNFIVFTGDIVRYNDQKSWDTVTQQLQQLGLPYFFALGNHDAEGLPTIGINLFENLFGNTYYTFNIQSDLFIVLDSQQQPRSISEPQLSFIEETLVNYPHKKRIFLFFHELLWNNAPEYQHILSNSRSRYQNIQASNYWTHLHPIFTNHPDRSFYVFAGDVGGKPDAISAFYDTKDNVTLIASGMGEVEDENFLTVSITQNEVAFHLVPLNPHIELQNLEYYSPEHYTERALLPQ